MYKIKTLLIVSLLLVINGCSLVPSFGKKKDKDPLLEESTETIRNTPLSPQRPSGVPFGHYEAEVAVQLQS